VTHQEYPKIAAGVAFQDRLAACDPSIFSVENQLFEGDRRSLLRIQNVVRQNLSSYVYLEVGSHLGGSLVPHLLDARCRHIYSIDKRPPAQPDERGVAFTYDNNSTQRMLDILARNVPALSLSKLETRDVDCANLTAQDIVARPDIVLIDAEHTNVAVVSDFLNVFKFCKEDTIFCFHDANLIPDGLRNIESILKYLGVPHQAFVLPDVIFAICAGRFAEICEKELKQYAFEKNRYFEEAKKSLITQLRAITTAV